MTDLGSLLDAEEPQITSGPGRPDKYVGDDGKVPSVTTITGILNVYLAKWANEHGLAGRDLAEIRQYERATDIGNYIHKVVVATIHGAAYPPPLQHLRPSQQEGVDKCLTEWHRWYTNTRSFEFEVTELPLVSNQHRFGGTLDAVARDRDGKLVLVDWKTSKGIYADYVLQVAAYGLLWNETQLEPITGGYYIVRFSKEYGDIETRYYPELERAEKAFLLLRELYDDIKGLEKRTK